MQKQHRFPAGLLLVLLLSVLAECAIVEVPLPYGLLRHKTAPKGDDITNCHHFKVCLSSLIH
jgi:hypothetical protein